MSKSFSETIKEGFCHKHPSEFDNTCIRCVWLQSEARRVEIDRLRRETVRLEGVALRFGLRAARSMLVGAGVPVDTATTVLADALPELKAMLEEVKTTWKHPDEKVKA